MTNVYDLSKARLKKYQLNLPVGEFVPNIAFNQVIIDNDIDTFFLTKLGKEWEGKTLRKAMEEGVVQVLLHWRSSTGFNDVYAEDIRIIMGLEQKVHYDNNSNEIASYTIYYQVGTIAHDISERLKTFDDTFSIFKRTVIEFINGGKYI